MNRLTPNTIALHCSKALHAKVLAMAVLLAVVIWAPTVAEAQSLRDDFAVASGYYDRQQWQECIPAFESLIKTYPNTSQANESYFFLGEAMMQLQMHREAYGAYQKFSVAAPEHGYAPRAMFRMGEAALLSNQLTQATRLLELFIRQNPGNPLVEVALPYLGETRLKRDEPQLAERAYQSALENYPGSPMENKARLGMAKSLQLQGEFEEAIRFYKLVSLCSEKDLRGQANLQLGIIEFGRGQMADARSYLGSALIECSNDIQRTESAYWLARAEIELGNSDRALRLYEEAANSVDIKPELASAILFDGAIAALNSDQQGVAVGWLEDLNTTYPESHLADDALQMRIDLARKNGETERAVSLIESFLQDYRESEHLKRVSETLGRIHYSNGDYDQSVLVFEELLAVTAGSDDPVIKGDRVHWKYLLSLGHLGENRFAAAEDIPVSYTHLRAHETSLHLVCRLLLEKKKSMDKQ